MFADTYSKAVLLVIATTLTIIALNPTATFAQASVGTFTLLSQEQKFYKEPERASHQRLKAQGIRPLHGSACMAASSATGHQALYRFSP